MSASIWVCGEVLVDVLPNGTVIGGGGANTAKALARLGCAVEFIDGISSDEYGVRARRELMKDGVGLSLSLASDKPTGKSIISIDAHGVGSYKFDNLVPNRAATLGLSLKPWRLRTNIVIAMQRHDSQQWAGLPNVNTWLADVVTEIKQHSNRPIVVRPHPRGTCSVPQGCLIDKPKFTLGTYDDFDFDRVLATAHCVLNWNSGPGPQALMAGIPVFVGPDSLASTIANWNLSQIENPPRPDRSAWLEQLAHTEWTVEEIRSGLPFRRLVF